MICKYTLNVFCVISVSLLSLFKHKLLNFVEVLSFDCGMLKPEFIIKFSLGEWRITWVIIFMYICVPITKSSVWESPVLSKLLRPSFHISPQGLLSLDLILISVALPLQKWDSGGISAGGEKGLAFCVSACLAEAQAAFVPHCLFKDVWIMRILGAVLLEQRAGMLIVDYRRCGFPEWVRILLL